MLEMDRRVKPEDDEISPSFSHLMRESMLMLGMDIRVKPEDDENRAEWYQQRQDLDAIALPLLEK